MELAHATTSLQGCAHSAPYGVFPPRCIEDILFYDKTHIKKGWVLAREAPEALNAHNFSASVKWGALNYYRHCVKKADDGYDHIRASYTLHYENLN